MAPRRKSRRSSGPGDSNQNHVLELLEQRGVAWHAFLVALGATVRAHRRDLDHTQETLSETLGVSVPWISVIECARGSPSLEMLVLFAHGFGVSLDELLAPAWATISGTRPPQPAVAELNAALGRLPPDRAEATAAALLALCKALQQA